MAIGENELMFAKVHPNAIIPSKREEDAALDIYACFDEDYMIIKAHQTKLIPTGIASALNPKYYIQIEERGSTGSKGIKKSAGVIDSGYRNEWFIAITNTNDIQVVISKISEDELIRYIGNEGVRNSIIYPYTKAIAQAVVHEVPKMNITELTYEELLMIKSERGIGKLGSTNK